MAHPGGRPQIYSPEKVATAWAYLKNYANFGDVVPSAVGLARVLEISRSTLYVWGSDKDKPEFTDILEEIQSKQERELLNKGLNGVYNSNIVKLMLGKHGYKEQKDTSLSNADGSPLFSSMKIQLVKPKITEEEPNE